LGAIYGVLLIAGLGILWTLRARIGIAPMVAVLLFVLSIFPMLNLLDPPAIRYSFVADNRQYLASAALIVLIAAVGTRIVESAALRQALNPAYCAGAVLVVLAVLSFHQGTIYLSNERLWTQTIADNGRSILAMEEYADWLLDLDQPADRQAREAHFDAAKAWMEQAQSLAPKDPRAAVGLGTVAAAEAYEEKAYGHPELMTTQQTSARQYFNDAIRLDPDFKPAYVALAQLLELEKDHNGAMDALRQAVRIEPESLRARLELGSALLRIGTSASLDEAQNILTSLVDDAPNISAAHSELGSVYIQQHNLDGALSEWQKALQLDPTNTSVLLNFGALLDSSNETELAAKQFLAATIIDPSLLQARLDLAHVYSKLGHRHDAVLQLTKAVELDSSNTDAQAALAKALADEKQHGPGSPASSQPSDGSLPQPASGILSVPANVPTTAG
jgi:Tfp pilus assembly protein PilF